MGWGMTKQSQPNTELHRCPWAKGDPYIDYHDKEWGVPVHDDRLLFESFLAVQEEYGSFDDYIWEFVGGKPKQNAWKSIKTVPAQTPDSDAMSKDLKRRGFKFVGSTICCAFMQAVGMVNDHLVDCFRHAELK